MDVNGEIQHFDRLEIKSKIKFFNDYNQKGKYGKKMSSYNKNWITLLLSVDSIIKEKPKHVQQGIVKQKVADIENLEKQFVANYTKTQNTEKKHEINMSNIINYLLDIQTHLRYDLNYINWPSIIIGKTTQTSIAYTNVIIKFDESDWN